MKGAPLANNPQLVIKRAYPKAIFGLSDVQADQADNVKDHALSSVITEDDINFYLTTTCPPITASVAAAAAPPAAAGVGAAQAVAPSDLAPPAGDAPPVVPVAALETFTTSSARDLASLRDEYQHFYDVCEALPAHSTDVVKAAASVTAGQQRYTALSARLGGHIPWQFIGITHLLEANSNFVRHLHNGDPMFTGQPGNLVWMRTTHVPSNRPPIWPAPTGESDPWIWSGMDAVAFEGFNNETDWAIPAMLWRFELYNGMGYRSFQNPSPYLWSFSQIYKAGKFDSDGHYNATLVSDQCGAALILKALFKT